MDANIVQYKGIVRTWFIVKQFNILVLFILFTLRLMGFTQSCYIKTYLLLGSVASIAKGLLHLKSVPPGWGLTFSSYPLRLAKIAFTTEDFHKIWVYPWSIGSYPWRIWVYPWRILWKLRLHPQRIPYFFTLPLKKSSIFITYRWRIPCFLNRGGGDIKCKSPIFFVSQKKKTFWSLYCRTARILTSPENTP